VPVMLVAVPLGATVALQVGQLTRQLGAQSLTGAAVMLGIVREASPLAAPATVNPIGNRPGLFSSNTIAASATLRKQTCIRSNGNGDSNIAQLRAIQLMSTWSVVPRARQISRSPSSGSSFRKCKEGANS